MAHPSPMPQSELYAELETEEVFRAGLYRLLGSLLGSPPDADGLAALATLTGDVTALGQAIGRLAHLAARSAPADLAAEFQSVFIGLGRGEVVPFGSYYLTGFLQEKPLARLRQDMEALGIERAPDILEPEDHIASLCEMMAGLIDGTFGDPLPLDEQKALYERHIASWAAYFFRDLEAAESSVFYAAVAAVGATFLQIEDEAFRMV